MQCPYEIPSLDDLFHQTGESLALGFVGRRSGFTAPLGSRGFTPRFQRELELGIRYLVHGLFVVHGRVALLTVWPFALGRSTIPEALGYYGLC
jgi:hypothetical protein